jgi:tellurite resistance protein
MSQLLAKPSRAAYLLARATPNRTRLMPNQAHDALIHLMILAASSDSEMTERELVRIQALIGRLPVFEGFDKNRLMAVANACADKLNGPGGLDQVMDEAIAALPKKLQDTAYAVAVEVASVDLHLEQEELRYLELLRDKLDLDRLTTAAIEVAARARHRRMPQ